MDVVDHHAIRPDLEPEQRREMAFMLNNPLLGFLSVEALHEFCLYSGLLGVGLYFAVAYWLDRHNPSLTE